MPLDLVQLVNLHVSGLTTATDKQMDERTALLKIRSKVTETIQRRFQGMDIYPTGAKQNFEDKVATIERCGLVTVSRFESEIVTMDEQEVFALEYLIAKVVATGRGQSGKVDALWTNYFSPAIVASGIVLASNDESWLESAIEENSPLDSSMTIEEKAEARLQAKASLTSPDSSIRIDFELADKVLDIADQIPGFKEKVMDVKLIYGRQINFAPRNAVVPQLQSVPGASAGMSADKQESAPAATVSGSAEAVRQNPVPVTSAGKPSVSGNASSNRGKSKPVIKKKNR
jgi:hypothetical protein